MSDLLTVTEVAALLNCSPETATRRFSRVKGVVDLGDPSNPRRRRYRVLRIPRQVVERWVLMRGGRIQVDPPTQASKLSRAKIAPTEDALVHDLAMLATQHGDAGRTTLERIARRARAMTHVPRERWSELIWMDEEDD